MDVIESNPRTLVDSVTQYFIHYHVTGFNLRLGGPFPKLRLMFGRNFCWENAIHFNRDESAVLTKFHKFVSNFL